MADQANKLLQENITLTNQVKTANAELATQLQKSITTYSDLLAVQTQLNKNLKDATSAKAQSAAQRDLTNNIKATALAEKEQIKIAAENEKLKRQKIATTQKEAQAAARVQRETAKLNSLYKQESARLTELRNKAKDVALQFGINSKEFKKAATEVNKLDANLKKIDSRLGQSQRFVGQYAKALGGVRNILGAAGFVGGFQLFFRTLKDGIKIARDYEKSNAVLASVLGKQLNETTKLQSESRRLGESTAFTASQVTELQTSLARLGKSEEDIIASTQGIINATIALGSETGETAALVGATLNAFNLSASESGKVADVLTLATQKSALSFEKLNTSLPNVAGAAAAVGVSFEEVVAQLSAAADRGIDASTSGTALRNIYLKLSAAGLTLDEALIKINSSTNKAETANKLFGVRAVTTALAIADNAEKTKELTEAYRNAGGTAEKVARTQLDTLDGKTKLLNSAFEGLILNVFNTEGVFGDFANTVILLTTALLNGLSALIKNEKELSAVDKAIKSVNESYENEEALLEDSNKAREQLIEALEEEGLSYNQAKTEADKYLETLRFINSELGKQTGKELEIALLKAEISLIEQSGDALGTLFDKKQQLKSLEDDLRFSKIKLN